MFRLSLRRIFLITALIWLNPSPVLGADLKGVYVSPSFVNIDLIDQKDQSVELTFGNNTNQDIVLDLSVVDFGTLNETGGVAFLTGEGDKDDRKYSLASWISLEKTGIVIDKGRTEKVKVKILNRESLGPGGHYGAVLAKIKTEKSESGSQVSLNQSFSSLIYVLKRGGEKAELKLKSIKVDSGLLKFPGSGELRFENSGNIHLTPRGKIEVLGRSGKMVGKGIVNLSSAIIMPESFRNYTVTIERSGKWIWPGKYEIQTSYRFDGLEKSWVDKRSVIYFGYEGILIVVVIFGAMLGLFKKLVKEK